MLDAKKLIKKTISTNNLKRVGIKHRAKAMRSVLKSELEKSYMIDCANSKYICMILSCMRVEINQYEIFGRT